MMTSVIDTLWATAGQPDPPGIDATPEPGTCAVTGERGPTWPTKSVLSANFGHLDAFHGRRIGVPAAWCARVWGPIRTATSRWRDMTIVASTVHRDGTIVDHPRGDRPAINCGTSAVVVPVTRKGHVWLTATWGAWATEAAVHSTAGCADAFELLAELRVAGLGEAEAREPQPRAALAKRLDMTADELWAAWTDLAPLRDRPELMDMALLVTRVPK